MAPHFGHLIFASFEIVPHPKEKTAKTANAKKILTHFLMTIHLLSPIDKELFTLIETVSEDYYIEKIFSKKFTMLSRKKCSSSLLP